MQTRLAWQVWKVGFGASVLLSACEPAQPPGGHPGAGEIPQAHVTQRWIVGGLEERAGVVFRSSPRSAALAEDGTLAVVDMLGSQVLVLDDDGKPRAVFSREGAGPGELQNPEEAGFLGDSILWVTDQAPGRMILFRPTGEHVQTTSSLRERVPSSPWSARPRWLLSDGWKLGDAIAPQAVRGDPLPLPVVVWNRAGELSVVAWLPCPSRNNMQVPTPNGFHFTTKQPIGAHPLLGIPAGGDWFFSLERGPSDQSVGTITITRYQQTGVEIDRIEIPYVPVPVDDEVRRSLHRRAEGTARQLPPHLGGVDSETIYEQYWIPVNLPPVQTVLADGEGFWLQRERTRSDRWERYDLAGVHQAVAQLPVGFNGLAAAPHAIVGSTRDSLGVHSLVRFDLEY